MCAAVGELIMASAFSRQESRGLHYNADFPQLAEHGASTIITDSFRRRHGVPSLIQGIPASGISNVVPAPAGVVHLCGVWNLMLLKFDDGSSVLMKQGRASLLFNWAMFKSIFITTSEAISSHLDTF